MAARGQAGALSGWHLGFLGLFTFVLAEEAGLKRVGNDLYTTATIDLYKAVLGGETVIDTFSGKVKLNIAPGTQNGNKVRLKGKGFPIYKKEKEFGDLYITFQVQVPTGLSAKEKELFTQLSKLSSTN
ncbi:MAG: hypothetical protein EOP04_18865 [Proteobacteria bacterium]|nr:MAG: hypothetical protein EOP04_18865 [Pseudomonadota bacterium]